MIRISADISVIQFWILKYLNIKIIIMSIVNIEKVIMRTCMPKRNRALKAQFRMFYCFAMRNNMISCALRLRYIIT